MTVCSKNETAAGGSIHYQRVEAIPGLELYRGVDVTRSVPRHVHGIFSLSIAEAGVRICANKKEKHLITPGGIYISSYGEAHDGVVPAGYSYTSRSLRMEAGLMQFLVAQATGRSQQSVHFSRPLVFDQELYLVIRQMYQAMESHDLTINKEYLLFQVIALLITRHAAEIPALLLPGDEADPIRRACDYLHDCYAENATIEQLAQLAGLSPFYFCRAFEKETGVPPHVYQLDIRLTQAARMLAAGNPIAAVAAETGFFDQSHFHKAFKRKFGVTPRQYRQK